MSSFGENDPAGLWKSGILVQCDLVLGKVNYTLGCTQRVKADHKPTPGVQHVQANLSAKDKKEVKCWHKSKIIREHSTSGG